MSRLARNILYNLAGQGTLLLLGFFSVKFIFSRLGGDVLGILYFTATLNAILSAVLEMGLSSTTVREVSSCLETEPGYIRELIRTFSLLYWGAFLLISGAIYFLAPLFVERWIHLTSIPPETAVSILRILGISSFLAFPSSLYNSILTGIQRLNLKNLVDVASGGLNQAGTIALLAFGCGLRSAVCWMAACSALKVLLLLLGLGSSLPAGALLPGYSGEVVRRNLRYASRMMLITLTSAFYMHLDKVILSKLMPIGLLGFYGAAQSLVSKASLIANSLSGAAFPSFSALLGTGDRHRLMVQYGKLQELVCYGTVPIFAVFPFAAVPLFTFLLNAEAARMLLIPTILLSLGFYMSGTLSVPYVFSLAAGRPGIAARQHVYDLIVVMPITAYLVYGYGIDGAALSLVIFYAFHYIYGIRKICKECLEMTPWKWYGTILGPYLIAAGTYGGAGIASMLLRLDSISALAAAYGTATLLYVSLASFAISGELRFSLMENLKSYRRSLVYGSHCA